MLAIQNYKTTNTKITFKQNENSPQVNNSQNNAHKTNSALYVAGAAAAINGVTSAATYAGLNSCLKSGMADADNQALAENIAKRLKKTWPVTTLAILGSGLLVNHAMNKKYKDFDKNLQEKGKENLYQEDNNTEKTRKGNLYYSSNTGKKVGTLVGAIALPLQAYTNNKITKIDLPKPAQAVVAISSAAIGAVGGLMLGGISDYFANKGAKKHADKTANVEQ